tara:strand:+ start:92 stop:385 length:294 start_codon:yes stop_codon:yes gene_type:complete
MSEKQQLSSTLKLLDDSTGKAFRTYRLKILLVVLLLFGFSIFTYVSTEFKLPPSIGMFLFFLLGLAFAKWDGLNRLKVMLPHLNKESIEKRLEKIDA